MLSTTQLLSGLAVLAELAASHPLITTRASCSPYKLLNVRGTNEAPNTFFATKDIIGAIELKRPFGSVYEVQYPADSNIAQTGTQQGVDDITRVIQTGLRDCPNQKYALLGYSQGATVVTRTLQKFAPDSPEGQVIDAVLMMGNPYHLPNKKGNFDENGGTSTAGASGVLVLTSDFRTPDSWYNSGRLIDICYTNDPICNGVNLQQLDLLGLHLGNLLGLTVPQLLITGQLQLQQLINSNHLIYPSNVDMLVKASNFIAQFLP